MIELGAKKDAKKAKLAEELASTKAKREHSKGKGTCGKTCVGGAA